LFSLAEERRNARLQFSEVYHTAYNNGDFFQLSEILKTHCAENVHFIAPNRLVETIGVAPLLAFFMICNEIFPDSVLKNISKRIASFKHPKPPPGSGLPETPPVTTEIIEFIDKFSGTKVMDRIVVEVFGRLANDGTIENPLLTVAEINQLVHDIFYSSGNPYASEEIVCSFISETALTFDLYTNKIIRWNYSILAVGS
jgi:hypothetical protein